VHTRRHTFTSALLTLVGLLCLLQGLSKALLWFGGARAPGHIAFQEKAVSRSGATWVRYQFTDRVGAIHYGTAMTAKQGAVRTRMQVAYLPLMPGLNMPAYGSYAALLGFAWSLAGLLPLGVSRLFLQAKPHPAT